MSICETRKILSKIRYLLWTNERRLSTHRSLYSHVADGPTPHKHKSLNSIISWDSYEIKRRPIFARELLLLFPSYVALAQNYFGFRRATRRRAASVHIMGCGGRTPSTQHIAVTLTSWATRRCAGLDASVHQAGVNSCWWYHILFMTFCSSMIWDNYRAVKY